MKAVLYYLSLPFIYLVAILPFTVVYFISDLFFLVLFYVLKYRRQVVIANLKNAFPQKKEEEINVIAKKYYRHLCDVVLETFKLLGMRSHQVMARCRFNNYELYHDFITRHHKSVVIALGHQGNWEWMGAATALRGDAPLQVIYRPLSNKYFNRMMLHIRSRFGATPVAANTILRKMYANEDVATGTAFLSDQTPAPDVARWVKFLNQETAVYTGTEKIARKFNYPVVFAAMRKVKRGFYEVDVHLIAADPAATTDGEITERHTHILEQEILAQPETWLWSHRRWKHSRGSTPIETI